MRQRSRELLRRIPLLGGLVDCSLRNHADTIGQTSVVLLLSTAPIWLGTLVIFSVSPLQALSLRAAFNSTIEHGELFMYGAALLAPIFWVALVDPPGARLFPSKVAHMVLIVAIDIISSAFFGLSTAGNHLKQPFTYKLSLIVFVSSIALLYLGTVYHSSRLPDASELFKQGEEDFTRDYNEHRK